VPTLKCALTRARARWLSGPPRSREGYQHRLAQQREAEVEAARANPPRWERRFTLPDVEGRREEFCVNLNLPQPPVWWEPKTFGPLPLPWDK